MYKVNQVLRTRVPLKAVSGETIAPSTRIVVTSVSKEDGKVRAKVADPNSGFTGLKLVASKGAFNLTHRGRPKGSKSKVAVGNVPLSEW